MATDERLRIIDEGMVVVTGLPPCPPSADVDLAPILDRIGLLESQVAGLQSDLADQQILIDEQGDALAALETTVTALLGDADVALWASTDTYPAGALVVYNDLLYVTTADVVPGAPAPDAGTPWIVVDVVAMATAP